MYLDVAKISAKYQFVIMLTGFSFSRFALLNKPRNMHLSICNGVMGCTAFIQMGRKL